MYNAMYYNGSIVDDIENQIIIDCEIAISKIQQFYIIRNPTKEWMLLEGLKIFLNSVY